MSRARDVRSFLAAGALAVASACLTACGHTEVYEAMVRTRGVPTGRAVEVYMGPGVPPRPYDDVAIVQAIGYGNEANLEDVVHALSERSGRLGCDAVVGVRVDFGVTMAHATGVCAKWTAE
ncbi:MAG: hypothetical protein U0169_03835 [Polyangiaceae bacterium]